MSEPLLLAPDAGAAPEQLALPGAKEMFEAVGLMDLPLGASALNKRQLEFCLHYLKSGSALQAATAAGYSDPEAHASKILKHPAVAVFLAKSISKVAGNADQLVSRVWERSIDLHAEIKRLREGKSSDWKKERELITAVNQTDTLLGSLIGKLVLKIEGSITHEHTVITPEARAQIIELQERLTLAATSERRTG
jgi:hypothetical protein